MSENEKNEDLISVNGNRSYIKKESSDFIIASYSNELVELLKSSGVNLNTKSFDIGHGCNQFVFGVELIDTLPSIVKALMCVGAGAGIVLEVGTRLADIKTSLEGYNWLLDKIKNVKETFKNTKKEASHMIYFNDEILLSIIINRILEKYKFKLDDINSFNLIETSKVKVGALGYYAIKNHNYIEKSLEGSPQSINYYVFELSSELLESDSEIITCQILSNGFIKYFDTLSVSTGNNFSNVH